MNSLTLIHNHAKLELRWDNAMSRNVMIDEIFSLSNHLSATRTDFILTPCSFG
jgi:hypothetical protein